MNTRALLGALVGVALLPISATAQLPGWLGQGGAEVRVGLSIGSHSASAAALEVVPKPSLDVVLKGQVVPALSVFGGYYMTSFGCAEGFCTDRDLTIVGNHGALGAEWVPRLPRLLFQPWLRGGVLFGSTEAGSEGNRPPWE